MDRFETQAPAPGGQTLWRACLLGLALAVCAISQVQAQRDNNPATESVPRVLPYRGLLQQAGRPVEGPVDVRFSLYDRPAGGERVWQEEWAQDIERAITVRQGRFTATLGEITPIHPALLDADGLYLGVEVRVAGEGEYTALAGRQPIHPAAFALWTAHAARMAVAGETRAGALDVTRTFRAARRLTVQQNLDLRGPLQIRNNPTLIYNAGADRLHFGPRNAFGGGVHIIEPLTLGAPDLRRPSTIRHSARFLNPVIFSDEVRLEGATAFEGGQVFSGQSTFNGAATFTQGVVINTRLQVTSSARFDRLFDARDSAEIDGTLRVRGDIQMDQCSLCLSIQRRNGNDPRMACVRTSHNNGSGWARFNHEIDGSDRFGLSFICNDDITNYGGVGFSMPQ